MSRLGTFSVFCVIFAAFYLSETECSVADREAAQQEIPQIEQEKECLAAGGHCVHITNCMPGMVSEEVECSRQKSAGVVCCHSAFPPNETRCEKLAGECKADCPRNLTAVQARDCPPNLVCCTLV